MNDLWSQLFQFDNYAELLVLVRNSIIAGAVLGLTGGLIGVFVMARDMAFAVHAISELSFAGAAAGLLFGVGVVQGSLAGSLAAALLIGLLQTLSSYYVPALGTIILFLAVFLLLLLRPRGLFGRV